jgi:hypothetical protein
MKINKQPKAPCLQPSFPSNQAHRKEPEGRLKMRLYRRGPRFPA